jgi:hypothetical protein
MPEPVLKNKLFSCCHLGESVRDEHDIKSFSFFDTLPGVEMADFAVNYRYLQRHPNLRGLGKVIFTDFVHPIIEDAARRIGVRLIYIFALPVEKLIERYGEYGFARLDEQSEEELHKRLKPQYDEDCIFMYQLL